MQDALPSVSVVVPIYNVERYLPQCLEALCSQTLRDLEIVAVNDGSTDGSLSVLQEWARKDERIVIVDKPNSGYGASMNCGIEAARGAYIGIVEPDDFPERDMFKRLLRMAQRHDCDLVKCNFFEHYEDRDDAYETSPISPTAGFSIPSSSRASSARSPRSGRGSIARLGSTMRHPLSRDAGRVVSRTRRS